MNDISYTIGGQLDYISIEVHVQNNVILYIDIDTGDDIIVIGSIEDGESYIESKSDGSMRYRWDSNDMSEYDNFIDEVPEYYVLSHHIGSSIYPIYNVLYTCTTYKEFIDRLKDTGAVHRDDMIYEDGSARFIVHDNIVKSIMYNHGIFYSVGEIEYIYYASSETYILDRDKISSLVPHYSVIYSLIDKPYNESIAYRLSEIIYGWATSIEEPISTVSIPIEPSIDIPIPTTDNLICIKSPESDRCDDGDGIPICIALIGEQDWYKIQCACILYKDDLSCIEHDYSSGGHGCVIQYNIPSMVSRCTIIRDLSDDVIAFIKKIESRVFIEFVQAGIDEVQE